VLCQSTARVFWHQSSGQLLREVALFHLPPTARMEQTGGPTSTLATVNTVQCRVAAPARGTH
jgi:hypothetical protein